MMHWYVKLFVAGGAFLAIGWVMAWIGFAYMIINTRR